MYYGYLQNAIKPWDGGQELWQAKTWNQGRDYIGAILVPSNCCFNFLLSTILDCSGRDLMLLTQKQEPKWIYHQIEFVCVWISLSSSHENLCPLHLRYHSRCSRACRLLCCWFSPGPALEMTANQPLKSILKSTVNRFVCNPEIEALERKKKLQILQWERNKHSNSFWWERRFEYQNIQCGYLQRKIPFLTNTFSTFTCNFVL